MILRDARNADMAAVTAIYAHHVLHGTATFDEAPPSERDMADRHAAIVANGLPWLVAETRDGIGGYCYAQRYHTRPAWRFTLEDAVYVAPECARRGLGGALLAELIKRCRQSGHREMIAVIGDSANAASIGLHAAAGFSRAGLLQNVGFKFGRPLDVVLMQRNLAGTA